MFDPKRMRALAGLKEGVVAPRFSHAELLVIWEAITQFADNLPEKEADGSFVDAEEGEQMTLQQKEALAIQIRQKLDGYVEAVTS